MSPSVSLAGPGQAINKQLTDFAFFVKSDSEGAALV